MALLLPKPSPILIQPTPWFQQPLWDACLGPLKGQVLLDVPTITHVSVCLGKSHVCWCVGLHAMPACVRLRRGAHICAVSLGF